MITRLLLAFGLLLFIATPTVSCGRYKMTTRCSHCSRTLNITGKTGIHDCGHCGKGLMTKKCGKCRTTWTVKAEGGFAIWTCTDCRTPLEGYHRCMHCRTVMKSNKAASFIRTCTRCRKNPYQKLTCPKDGTEIKVPARDAKVICRKCRFSFYFSYCGKCNFAHQLENIGRYQCEACDKQAFVDVKPEMVGVTCFDCNKKVNIPDRLGQHKCSKCSALLFHVDCRHCAGKQVVDKPCEFSCYYCKRKQSFSWCSHCGGLNGHAKFEGKWKCGSCKGIYRTFLCRKCGWGSSVSGETATYVPCNKCKVSQNIPK